MLRLLLVSLCLVIMFAAGCGSSKDDELKNEQMQSLVERRENLELLIDVSKKMERHYSDEVKRLDEELRQTRANTDKMLRELQSRLKESE